MAEVNDTVVGLSVACGDVVDATFAVGANDKGGAKCQNKVALKENKERDFE